MAWLPVSSVCHIVHNGFLPLPVYKLDTRAPKSGKKKNKPHTHSPIRLPLETGSEDGFQFTLCLIWGQPLVPIITENREDERPNSIFFQLEPGVQLASAASDGNMFQ